MGTKALEIRITGNNSDLKRAVNESIAALAKLDQAAATGTKKRKTNDEEVAKAQFINLGKLQVAGIKYQDSLVASAKQSATKILAGEEKLAADIERLFVATNRMQQRELAKASREKEAIFRREAQNSAKVSQKTTNDLIKHSQQQAKESAKGFNISKTAANQFKDAIGSIAGQFTLLNVGQAIVSSIADNFERVRQSVRDSVEYMKSTRQEFLALAALKDHLGDTTKETGEQIAFRAQTLQTQGDSKSFQEQFLGSGESARGKLVPEAEFDKFMAKAGEFQAAEGSDAGTHGRFAGMMPQMTGGKLKTADELIAAQMKLYNIMKPGGFDFAQGMEQLASVSSYAQIGAYKNIDQEGALLSAFSTLDKNSANTTLEQFTRGTIGSLGRLKGPKVEGADTEKVGTYLKGLGANDQEDAIAIGQRISNDLAKQDKASQAAGKIFQPITYLSQHGYGNQEERDALIKFYGLNKSGQYESSFAPRAESATGLIPSDTDKPGFVSGQQRVQNWRHSSPDAVSRRADLVAEMLKTHQGVGTQSYDETQREIFATMVGQGRLSGTYDSYKGSFFQGGEHQMFHGMGEAMVAEANRVGIPAKYDSETNEYQFKGMKPLTYNMYEEKGDITRAGRFNEISAGIGAAGGNVSEAVMNKMLTVAQSSLAVQQKMEAAMNTGATKIRAPLPAGPAPSMRNAAR